MTVVVEPTYFQTVVRGLVLGESFSELHGTPGYEAAIVNQRFADVYLGAGNPLGRHLDLRPPSRQPRTPNQSARTMDMAGDHPVPPVPVTIIGVAPDIRQGQSDAVPMVYLPFRAETPAGVTLIVRGSGGPARIVSVSRDAANALDPDLALGVVKTMDDLRDVSRSPWSGMASQFARIGVLALVLSGVGLYSAMAYSVRRRTQEIAIRMALGTQATHVRWLFLRTGTWVIAAGLGLGVPASLMVGRLLQANVARTDALDVGTLMVTGAVLVTVALTAALIPAHRATRLEPTIALRID
jgi:ABC-type antimicrobial peptide transport system permease subunit